MTSIERFQLCQEQARRIVASYRAEAPDGCDPINTWVAVAGTVVSVGVGAYQASQQKKAAAKQQQQMGSGSAPSIPPVQFPDMPKYVPVDWPHLEENAAKTDLLAYKLSDQDYAARHPAMLGAEKAFEAQTLQDQTGDSKFLPQMQQEALRSGLGSSLSAFGDAGPVLARGSGAEADVAKNLGLSVLAFQDRNRQNAQRSLSLAEEIFPRRQIGLTGKDNAQVAIGNLSAQNAWNQANHAATVDELEFNAKLAAGNQATALNQGNAQAAAGAQASQAQAQLFGSIAQSAIGGVGKAYGSYMAQPSGGYGAYGGPGVQPQMQASFAQPAVAYGG